MNGLQIFSNPDFGSIRTTMIDCEPWFIAIDVTTALGYSNSRDAIKKHVDDDDKNTVAKRDGIPGNPNLTIINESGLYSLIFSSKLPDAKKFKRWVTSEVLPSIRKTGRYAVPDAAGGTETAQGFISDRQSRRSGFTAYTDALSGHAATGAIRTGNRRDGTGRLWAVRNRAAGYVRIRHFPSRSPGSDAAERRP